MSRVGLRKITIPTGVHITINGHNVTVKGPMGELHKSFSHLIDISQVENHIVVTRQNEERQTKMLHGTTNSLIQGMVEGVSKGFTKSLEIVGVGYNVKAKGKDLEFSLGFAHKVIHHVPAGIKAEIISPTELKISGIDKQLVGLQASIIKKYKKPEPYGGKGIKYKGEHIRRKAGKAAAK